MQQASLSWTRSHIQRHCGPLNLRKHPYKQTSPFGNAALAVKLFDLQSSEFSLKGNFPDSSLSGPEVDFRAHAHSITQGSVADCRQGEHMAYIYAMYKALLLHT